MRNKVLLLIIVFSIGLVLISCEEVIDINLENSEPRIVIEGTVGLERKPFSVKISKSSDYFQPDEFPKVSGAFVEITDDQDNIYDFHEVEPGLYQTDTTNGYPGRTYTLNIEVEGETYTASSTMPADYIFIRYLSCAYNEGGGFGEESEEGYVLYCTFTDPEGVDNYGRFIIERNGVELEEYSLYVGTWSDGKTMSYDWYGFDSLDNITVKLLSIDEPTYDYFKTLSEIVIYDDSLKINWSPANPVTNFDNNALGYFAAYFIHTRSIIIQ